MKKLIYCLFLLCIIFGGYLLFVSSGNYIIQQDKTQEQFGWATQPHDTVLCKLRIKSVQLYTVLDSIIENEYKCCYYSDSIYFDINVNQLKDNTWYIVINSADTPSSIAYLHRWGFFYYKNKLFTISGRQFCEELFVRTKEKKVFPFKPFFTYIDDSFSQWLYLYKDGNFQLEQFVGCD